jgi:hypothetical protein
LFKAPTATNQEKKEGDEGDEDEGEDDNFGKGDGSPPAFGGETAYSFGDAARPVKLTIESRPPEKSPYTKVFNVSSNEIMYLLITMHLFSNLPLIQLFQ